MTASTSHPITISPYLKGIGFETRTTPLVDSNVDWNGRESRSVPFEFEAGREYCLSHQVVVHTNFGRTTWGVESSLVADSDFIQESKIHQLFKSLFNASESIEDSAERDKTRISLQKDKEMLMDMYLRVRSAHQRITYHWAVKGSGNFFDRKGGSAKLFFRCFRCSVPWGKGRRRRRPLGSCMYGRSLRSRRLSYVLDLRYKIAIHRH